MENNVNFTSNFLLSILILFGIFTFSSVNSNEIISDGKYKILDLFLYYRQHNLLLS